MKVPVKVDGRELTLSNLDKVLYPDYGFTKAEVIDYYSRIAPVLLPHLQGRPLTVKRYPNGVTGQFFFEKNAPEHTPGWVRRVNLPAPGSTKNRETIDFAVVDDLPTLVYYANLAALELHVPQWRVDEEGTALPPDTLVFDLDPGAPATIVECTRVALMLREVLKAEGLTAVPKTSGNKGMQLYADWDCREEAGPVPGEGASRRGRQRHDEEGAARQGVHRLEPEQPGQDHRRPLLAARQGAADRLDTADLEGGRGLRAA